MSSQREQCYRGCIYIRRVRNAKRDTVARIPASAGTHSIQEHGSAQVDPQGEIRAPREPPFCPPQGHQTEGCWDHPTRRAPDPVPTVLRRIELDIAIDKSKLQLPEQ